jgi:hypothetical protein
MDVMSQAIEQRAGQALIAKDACPFIKWKGSIRISYA